jgi:glutamyl-tRNA reductase
VTRIFVANRAFERAEQLAEKFGGEAVSFEAMTSRLETCDIVIASTGAPHYLVGRAHVEAAFASRRRRNLFLVDLSVPRNIDPEVASVDGAYLYNIDDLQQVADANLERRLQKAEKAEEIVEHEVEAFMRRLATHDAIPTIVELQNHLEEIRRSELEKCLRRIGPVSAEQQAAIEALTASIVNKILHYPIVRLKESVADKKEQGETMRETIRRLFGLR